MTKSSPWEGVLLSTRPETETDSFALCFNLDDRAEASAVICSAIISMPRRLVSPSRNNLPFRIRALR